MNVWLQFSVCTVIILIAGTRLSKYADIIAEKSGMGGTWVGIILLASITSLPEVITGISSVTLVDLPDIAAGDVLGSCMFNVFIIALIDLLSGPIPISSKAHQGQVLTAGFGILLLGVISTSIYAGPRLPAIGWIGPYSIFFILAYLIALRMVFVYERRRLAEYIADKAELAKYEQVSGTRAYLLFVINAIVIVVAATYLPTIGEQIAEKTGLGGTFAGSIFIALSTSLPELIVSVSALRIGAVDMVFGDLFGSNLFNIVVLAVDDILYTKGPLLASISGTHLVSANAAIVMTAIAIIGLTYKTSRKFLFVAGDSLTIIAAYALAIACLYWMR